VARSNIIQSVGRAIEILECFKDKKELGVSEISRMMNLNKSTAFGLITTLEAYKLLEKNEESNKYRLGIELFILGSKINSDLKSLAESYLESLVDTFEETAHLVTRDGYMVIYLDKIESTHSMRICSRVGERLPIYCTGVGKAILANLPEDELKEVLDNINLEKMTPYTIIDRKELLKHLQNVREKGFAEDLEEIEVGLKCVAAPIFDHTDKAIAAISVAGPAVRMTDETRAKIAATLVGYTKEISEKLGYKP
jgi:DNA-binding IclR family transcriptional regulator